MNRGALYWSVAALVAIVAGVSLAPLPADLLREQIHDAAHVVVFTIFGTLLVRLLVLRLRSLWTAVGATLVLGVLAGALTEYAQSFLAGDPSIGDVGRDLLGTTVGCLLMLPVALARATGRRSSTVYGVAWLLAAAGLFAGMVPLLATLAAYHERDRRLPVLLDPAIGPSLAFAEIRADARQSSRGIVRVPQPWNEGDTELAIDVPLEHSRWPGLTLREPSPDWRGYRALMLDLVNPGERPLELGLRVDDVDSGNAYEQRYNGSFTLPARTRRQVEVTLEQIAAGPRHRHLDLARIRQVIVFHDGPLPGERFLLRELRLER